MKHNRHRAREFALQGLYQWQLSKTDPATIRAQLAEADDFSKCDTHLFERMWTGITTEFDALVSAFAPHSERAAAQLSPVERGVLVIGAWELLHQPQVPYRVAINEAVELAKSYGGTDGHKYVNGVLDKLAAQTRAPEISAARV
ncbi:MAG: transcription antitermination factor NusB [Casimicrobiaceae bacterium]